MKKMLLWLLVITPMRPALCMEASMDVEESQTSLSPFYITELRLLITQQLCQQYSMEKALTTIKAWAMTDTQAWALFQTKESAHVFINWFYRLSYLNNFSIALLEKLKALVNQEELATFNQSLEKGAELVKLFDMCTAQKDWYTCLTQLTTLEKASLSKYLAGYYWESSYMDSYAQKTLLCYALELQAPQEVIQTLIDWGSHLTPLKDTTPSPCLLVCQNIVNTSTQYERKDKELRTAQILLKEKSDQLALIMNSLTPQNRANEYTTPSFSYYYTECAIIIALKLQDEALASLEKKGHDTLKGLKETLTMLIEKKANPNHYFWVPTQTSTGNCISPLLVAAGAANLDLLYYLLEQGAVVSPISFPPLLVEFVQSKIPLFIIEALVSKVNSTDLLSLLRLTVKEGIVRQEREAEAFCKVLALLLNYKDSAINAVENGFTVLDLVHQRGKNNSKIALLLTQHGALLAPKDEQTQQIADLAGKTYGIKARAEIAPLLQKVKKRLLNTQELKIPEELIFQWLKMALMVYLTDPECSEEGKEFLKYIALRFPHIPLYYMFVTRIHTIKLQLKNNEAHYQSHLKKAQDLILWLGREGIKDISKLPARELAKQWGLHELVDSLTSVLPD